MPSNHMAYRRRNYLQIYLTKKNLMILKCEKWKLEARLSTYEMTLTQQLFLNNNAQFQKLVIFSHMLKNVMENFIFADFSKSYFQIITWVVLNNTAENAIKNILLINKKMRIMLRRLMVLLKRTFQFSRDFTSGVYRNYKH